MVQIPIVGDHLAIKITNKILEVRINRPKQLNTMNDELENEIAKILDWAEEETSIWVIIITGTGNKAFW